MSKLEDVKQFIQRNNIQAEIIEHEQSGLTSEDAAQATGVKIEQIIKTLLFIGKKCNLAIENFAKLPLILEILIN